MDTHMTNDPRFTPFDIYLLLRKTNLYWAAVDKDKTIYLYVYKPRIINDDKYWFPNQQEGKSMRIGKLSTPIGDWAKCIFNVSNIHL